MNTIFLEKPKGGMNMDEMRMVNRVVLTGFLSGRPVFSHESRGHRFFRLPLGICRLSGVFDTINIVTKSELLQELEVNEADMLCVVGELRSYNEKSSASRHLIISVLAQEISLVSGTAWENEVELTGTLCKPPNPRVTPMGREICDLMLAVNRRYGRSDYLPCIAWGRKAREASLWEVGTKIRLNGRIQSRLYIKNADGILKEKTAYEVSIIDAYKLEEQDTLEELENESVKNSAWRNSPPGSRPGESF
jgi:single-stranded DNA-binding protein